MSEQLYIVGHPVAHSKSPAMYNALYPSLGLDWRYDLMDIPEADDAQAFLRAGSYLSVNITTPYKPLAFAAADIKAASATLAQGVNLLIHKNDTLIGFNVDGEGCIAYLEHAGVSFAGKNVAVCGTGPTSLAIMHSAAQAGARSVLLLSRDKERARAQITRYLDDYHHLLSTAIQLPAANPDRRSFKEAYDKTEFSFGSYTTSTKALFASDVIIDATPLGMKPGDGAPFDTSLIHADQIVLDVVYGHGETEIIRAARAAGARALDGRGMLVSQAVITATMVCEVNEIDIDDTYEDLFDRMAEAAGFDFSA